MKYTLIFEHVVIIDVCTEVNRTEMSRWYIGLHNANSDFLGILERRL
jgi:hypothetical protein